MNRYLLLVLFLTMVCFSFGQTNQISDNQVPAKLNTIVDSFDETDVLLSGTITSVDPSSATIPESLTVEISGSGTHFAQGTGTIVWFSQGSNTIYSNNVTALNNTLVLADMLFSNNNNTGDYDVNTYNSTDGYLVLPDGFYLNPNPTPPVLTGISPESGEAGQIVYITVYGENTNFAQTYNYVYLYKSGGNSFAAVNIEVTDDEILVAEFHLTSGSNTGLYSLYLQNPWDGNLNLNNVFILNGDPDPPYLTGIEPDQGTIPETLTVTISGINTHFNQGTGTYVHFRQGSSSIIYPDDIDPISDTELNATFTFNTNWDDPGMYDVRTYSGLDGTLNLYNAFYLNPNPNPPMLVSIDPDQAQPGETLNVFISGQNTNFTQGTGTWVWLNQFGENIYPDDITEINDELLEANFSILNSAQLGYYNVNTANVADGPLSLTNAFEVYEFNPQIIGLDPGLGYLGDTLVIEVQGSQTHFMEAGALDAWFSFEGMNMDLENIVPFSNDVLIMELIIPPDGTSPAGLWDFYVSNDIDGEMYFPNAFEVIDTLEIGIHENTSSFEFKVIPNPNQGIFIVSFKTPDNEELKMSIHNHQGIRIDEFYFSEKGVIEKQIDLTNYPDGIYIIRMTSNGRSVVHKVIVSK